MPSAIGVKRIRAHDEFEEFQTEMAGTRVGTQKISGRCFQSSAVHQGCCDVSAGASRVAIDGYLRGYGRKEYKDWRTLSVPGDGERTERRGRCRCQIRADVVRETIAQSVEILRDKDEPEESAITQRRR